MKKSILIVTVFVLVLSLIACQSEEESTILKVGATPVPHAELLELVREELASEGIELEVIEFTDYVTPNTALDEGSIDANFFQHVPYLDNFNEEHGLELVSVGTVHVEPLGLYTDKYDSLDDLPNGSVIAIPNDSVNGGRALILLESAGLIILAEDAGLEATEKDIVSNPHEFEFKALDAAQLPRVLVDVDAAIINGNYALEADLNPVEDTILLEGAESPYANIITVKAGSEEDARILALLNALQSDTVKNYILKTYNGGVVPAF
jgi:D-methionine transport system substrate-binding protein